jgi:hypothetical protein
MRLLAAALLLAALGAAPVAGEEQKEESRAWVEVSVFCQCCEPPWGKSEWDIRPFFARYGIPVTGYRKEPRIVCAECSCPSPVRQLIRVPEADVPRVRELLARSPNVGRVLPNVVP